MKDVSNSACVLMGSSLHPAYGVIFAVFNTIMFCCNIIMYIMISKLISSGRKKFRSSNQNNKSQFYRMGIIVSSNFAMSMTVGVLSIVALFVPVSGTLESIAAFVLLPVNACINPRLIH